VLRLQLPENGICHSPIEASVLKPPDNACTAIFQGQALPALPLLRCLSKEMIHGSFWYGIRCLVCMAILEHTSCYLVYFCLWHPLLGKCLIRERAKSDRNMALWKIHKRVCKSGNQIRDRCQNTGSRKFSFRASDTKLLYSHFIEILGMGTMLAQGISWDSSRKFNAVHSNNGSWKLFKCMYS
jgi:hypothetical protein